MEVYTQQNTYGLHIYGNIPWEWHGEYFINNTEYQYSVCAIIHLVEYYLNATDAIQSSIEL